MKYEIFGESHGPAIGIVVKGVPAGIELDMDFICSELARRAPGKNNTSTARKESDFPEIISGVKDGVTTGAPLCAMIRNSDTHSSDYSEISHKPRPSHSDYPAWVRYQGNNDIRGGGHFSARLTAPLVFVGALAKTCLKEKEIMISSSVKCIGGIMDPNENQIEEVILSAKQDMDSVGGMIHVSAQGIPAGIGGPDYGENVEGEISRAVFSIPAVKGIQFGAGFDLANMRGSQANDPLRIVEGKIITTTNHAGGINGGISNGMPIEFDVVLRPTPSIGKQQDTVDLDTMENTTLIIKGRHDPCVVLRALPVLEAATAVALFDLIQRSGS